MHQNSPFSDKKINNNSGEGHSTSACGRDPASFLDHLNTGYHSCNRVLTYLAAEGHEKSQGRDLRKGKELISISWMRSSRTALVLEDTTRTKFQTS